MANYREGDKRQPNDIPTLDDFEPGNVCGAALPMSASAQQLRERIEVIEYLLH